MPIASFADLPAQMRSLLGAGEIAAPMHPDLPARASRVAFILLDAFGYEFVQRHADHPVIERMRPVQMRSQFPSTTTAHVTTINTGLGVGEHGMYEWLMRDPKLGPLYPLPQLMPDGSPIPPYEGILPAKTFYETLPGDSLCLHPGKITDSYYTRVMTRGADRAGYEDLSDGLAKLVAALAADDGPQLVMLYYPEIDTVGHLAGPASAAFDETSRAALDALDTALAALPEDTVVLLTADHGQIDVSPERVDFLDELYPGLADQLTHAPCGSPRDCFLHVREPERVAAELAAALGGRGDVRLCAELMDEGYFGVVGPRLVERIADVCVLPAPGRSAWLASHPSSALAFLGSHGGLTDEESMSFLGVLRP